MRRSAAQRLTSKVEIDDAGCWLWRGAVDPTGYGRFFLDGRMDYAHRAAYRLLVGPIPEGLDIDHLCRVRACVNPQHLEAVTRRENLLRGDTLTRAHVEGRDCGNAACSSCSYARTTAALAESLLPAEASA